jgi:hypothetical protein
MRNKKQPDPEPTPEQVAVELHVEAMMNPRPLDASKTTSIASPVIVRTKPTAPIDIFQGLPAEKIPVNALKTAPEIPGSTKFAAKNKSIFSSVEALNRPPVKPVAAAAPVKPSVVPVSAPLLSAKPNVAADLASTIPTSLVQLPKTSSLGGSNPRVPSTAITVDDLARREEYTDAAIDTVIADIVAKEGDELLAAEDANAGRRPLLPIAKRAPGGVRARSILTSKWLLLAIPLILIALAAVPYSRYKLAGLFIKKTLAITVVDSKTNRPVSSASVSFDGLATKTNTAGQAELTVPVGPGSLSITKGYYHAYSLHTTIGLGPTGGVRTVNLVATGRQVPITIRNKLTNKALPGVTVKILNTSAVSDSNGKVNIVLPADQTTDSAQLSAPGYNTRSLPIQITDVVVPANAVTLTPEGSIYFLSKASGTIDVVKTNLDGTGRSVVLAGTGHEDPASTNLIASRDWRYVVLRAHRDASQSGLYLIDTTTDKSIQFDTSTSNYTSIGWSGHNFVYYLVKTGQPNSQASREIIKSYNADQQQLNQLDQNQVLGDSTSYGYQSFSNFYVINSQLVYNTQWYSGTTSGTAYDLSNQTDSIRTVAVAGGSKKDIQTYAAASTTTVSTAHVLPLTIDYAVANNGNSKTTYYSYNTNAVTNDPTVTATTFTKTYPAYKLSPDSTKNFWNDVAAGKQSLLIGDKNAASPTTVASAGEYTAYGWYTGQYLLLSRAGSGLYIMPVETTGMTGTPMKITDYYQPVVAPSAYGGGF